jgi:hypothetical protein
MNLIALIGLIDGMYYQNGAMGKGRFSSPEILA